jgi:hypothetical protein
MDVFVIPVARDRYELYCETSADADQVDGPVEPAAPVTGWRRWKPGAVIIRLRERFWSMLKAAEHRQRHRDDADEPRGWMSRLQERGLSWMVERIAEQKLLWNLRSATAATLAHPQDMTFDQVLSIVRAQLRHDYERHRRWTIIDGVLFVLSFILLGPLFLLIPGVANLPALYFGFRVVGHWLSMRGARQGLDRVQFTGRPCPPLTELRDLVDLEPAAREERIHDIAGRLRLAHLATFYARLAI